jgi:curved DNA-binding protein CbpA
MKDLAQYYRILGLELGASLEEINQAYRDLAFIWHPDRIPPDNQRLMEKAITRLKDINHARDQLRQLEAHSNSPKPKTEPKSTYSPPSRPPQSHASAAKRPTEPRVQRPYHRDLSGADLRGANLREQDLSGRKLIQADLSYADLSDSFLHKVNLEAANLFGANLFRANLLEANLRKADLREVNLIGADLSGADLSQADLRGAKMTAGDRLMVKLTAAILTGTILPNGTIHD